MTLSETIDEQKIIKRKTLNRLFDDAIDELEITFDVYFEIERYRPRCMHIMNRILLSGIRQGKVLILGSNEKPFIMFFEKLGFQVEGLSSYQTLKDEKENKSEAVSYTIKEIGDLKADYDIIICDDILQHLASPVETLTILKDHVRPGGVITITTPNVARGTMRLRLLTGRNIYPFNYSNELMDEDIQRLMPYREYTLLELESLVKNVGLELMQKEFIIGKNVNANMWPPMPVKEYFFQSIFFAIQKIAVPLRNYIFVVGRKPFEKGENSVEGMAS